MAEPGVKYDEGKLPWDLFTWRGATRVTEVLAFGAKKYSPNGWRAVPDAKRRYIAAAFRHLIAYATGEASDPESGLPHLAHAACCILFVLEIET